jgi:hypothetical protein
MWLLWEGFIVTKIMARPQRNNIDYFPFLCEEGSKMFYLEETYGNDGFATFLKILRELAKTDFHYLDLSKNTTRMFLSAKCKVSKETLESIIKDLVELEKFDSELWNNNSIIWCQDFIDSIQDAYNKRTNNCIDRNGLMELLISKGVLKRVKVTPKPSKGNDKGGDNPQSIVKYSILKNNKEKETLFLKWLAYRKEIKKPIKVQSTLQGLTKKFNEKSLEELTFVINASIENGWQGLIWEKYDSKKQDLSFSEQVMGKEKHDAILAELTKTPQDATKGIE